MDDQDEQDPLEYFQARSFFQPLSEADQNTVESAKNAIDTVNRGNLTHEMYERYQRELKDIIDMSPNQVATASYLQERIGKMSLAEIYLIFRNGCEVVKTGGRGRPTQSNDESEDGTKKDDTKSKKSKSSARDTKFSRNVKGGGICQVTGAESNMLIAAHILPLAASNQNKKAKQYLELINALFGSDALQRLLENVLNADKGKAKDINRPDKDKAKDINRSDNGIAMQSTVHDMWDGMYFYLEVLWDTYNSSTNEFDAKFHWLSDPRQGLINYWKHPFTTPDGYTLPYPLVEGDIIQFRRRNSPSSSSATTPSSLSTPSLTPTPSSTNASKTTSKNATKPAFPSAHLLYVREILTRIANIVGAAGYLEYDLDDDDDDISVLASDLGEEETGKLSDREQAEERMSQEDISQVAAWAEMSSSYIEEQRKLATQSGGCIDEHPNATALGKNCVGKQSNMPILGKRRRSWTEGMKLAPVEETQPGFRSSQSTGSETGSDSDSDPFPAMDRCLTIAI